MRYVVGVFIIAIGSLLAASNASLAERTGASNNAFFKSDKFTEPGWTRWNRLMFVLVGGFFAVSGLLLVFGVVDLAS